MLGVCYCDPGFDGAACERNGTPPSACQSWPRWRQKFLADAEFGNFDEVGDACFKHPAHGVARVSRQRWRLAMWAGAKDYRKKDNRSEPGKLRGANVYTDGFAGFAAVASLGHVLEVGCGPHTVLGLLLDTRPDLAASVASITLLDPGLTSYLGLQGCPYSDGRLRGLPVAEMLNCGAESIPYLERFDTVVMINVLEHVMDAYAVLEGVFRSLRRGGQLILHDRLLPERYPYDLLHPVRLNFSVFDAFTSGFHKEFDSYGKMNGRLEVHSAIRYFYPTFFYIGIKGSKPGSKSYLTAHVVQPEL